MRMLVWLLFFLPGMAAAQNPGNAKKKEIKLTADILAPGEIKLPFSHINILDNRFDTSKIGFSLAATFFGADVKQMCLKPSVSGAIENYYNDYYANAFAITDVKLLIVIKKFWVSVSDGRKNKELDIIKNKNPNRFLHCKLEYYLQKQNELLPFKRVDTILNVINFNDGEEDIKDKKKMDLKLVLQTFIEMFDFSKAVQRFDSVNKKSQDQVMAYNKSYFDIPVLKDSVIHTGVFLTFEEFKNNKPSIINFREKKMSKGLFKNQFFIEDEYGNAIAGYWGYCSKGKVRIGKYDSNQLYKNNNTFEFYQKSEYVDIDQGSNGIPPSKSTSLAAYQLDMETGAIY